MYATHKQTDHVQTEAHDLSGRGVLSEQTHFM